MKNILLAFVMSISTFLVNAQSLDYQLSKDMNKDCNGTVSDGFKAISNSEKYFIIVAPVTLLGTGFIRNSTEFKKAGIQSAIALCISTVASTALKNSIKRARPFDAHSDITKRSDGGGYSFPSGHTSSAFAIATSLSLSFPKWYVIAPAYTYASLVGVSRVALGVHYPTDVLCGAAVGVFSAFASNYLNKKLFSGGKAKKMSILKL
jgi:membrane-associated phospholipid phosphatase